MEMVRTRYKAAYPFQAVPLSLFLVLCGVGGLGGCFRKSVQPTRSMASTPTQPPSSAASVLSPEVIPAGKAYRWDGQRVVWGMKGSLEQVSHAAMDAFRSLQFSFNVPDSRRGTDYALLVANQDNGRSAQVEIRKEVTDPGLLQIKVLVGVVGDRSSSERILDELRKKLPAKP